LEYTISDGKKERLPDEPRAFLLWEKDGKFRAVLGDLTVATFEKSGTDPKQDDFTGWRSATPDEEVAQLITFLAKKDIDDFWDDGENHYFDRMSFYGQAFVLARYCAGNHREDLAVRLLRVTEERLRKEKGDTLQEALDDEIGSALRWRATLAWSDSSLTRHALATLFRNIVKHCPRVFQADWIAKTASALEQMATEDDAHPKLTDEEFARLKPDEQARELVFRLRDDNQNFEEIWPRPWPFEPTRGNGAMKKLASLGLPAVPALLEALKDDRPTRSVYRNNRYGGGAWPSNVNDLAVQALQEIAGVNFFWLIPNGGGMKYEDRWREMRTLAEDWWKTTQEKGDTDWLRARVVSGSEGAQYCLEAIAKKHPDALAELATRTVPTLADPRIRADIVKQLEKIQTPEVNQLLLTELTDGPTRVNRVAAAYLLRDRHQPEALAAMLAEFDATPKTLLKKSSFIGISNSASGMNEPDSIAHVLGFLLSSDSILAVQAIRAALPQFDRQGRAGILQASVARILGRPGEKIEAAGKEVRKAIEEMLLSELNDNEVLEGSSYNGTNNPKVAEIAAMTLAACWSDRYTFKIDETPEKRAAQLAAIRARITSPRKELEPAVDPGR
jgi:hypothetical protein